MANSQNMGTTNQYIIYWLNCTENSYSVANNSSVVTVDVWIKRTNTGYTTYGSGQTNLTINGTVYSDPISNSETITYTARKVFSKSVTIGHNADGSKTLAMACSITNSQFNGSNQGYNQVLTTIPRASTFTRMDNWTVGSPIYAWVTSHASSFTHNYQLTCNHVIVADYNGVDEDMILNLSATQIDSLVTAMAGSHTSLCGLRCITYSGGTQIGNPQYSQAYATTPSSYISGFSNFTVGNTIPISVWRYSSLFVHDYTIAVGSSVIAQRFNIVGTDGSIVLSTDETNNLYSSLAFTTQATITVYCQTKIGGVNRGSSFKKDATVYVGEDIKPIVSSITASATSAITNTYIRNMTPITFTINGAVGMNYAELKSYNINFNGKNYSAGSVNVGVVNSTVPLTATARVTDNRGRWTERTVVVNFTDYRTPTISNFDIQRSDVNGAVDIMGIYAKVIMASSVATLKNGTTEKNVLTYKVYSKLRSATTWNLLVSSTSLLSLNKFTTFSGYPIISSYDFKLEVNDIFNNVASADVLSTGQVTMSLGKTGIGVGKVWERGALDVGGDVYVDGSITAPTFNGNVNGTLDGLDSSAFARSGYGLGTPAISISDVNVNRASGWYMGSGAANAPNTGWWWYECIQHNSIWCTYRATSFNGANLYIKNQINGVWSGWTEMFHSGSTIKSASPAFTGESHFSTGTYSDPWSGTSCAVKVTGNMAASGVIKGGGGFEGVGRRIMAQGTIAMVKGAATTYTHNLGYYPLFTIEGSLGTYIWNVNMPNANQITVFNAGGSSGTLTVDIRCY